MRLGDSSNGEVSRDDAVGVGVGMGMGVTGGDDQAGMDNLSSSSRPFRSEERRVGKECVP